VRSAIPTDNPVTITYPYATGFSSQPIQWQMDSWYHFCVLGGYAHVPNLKGKAVTLPNAMDPPGLRQFLTAQMGLRRPLVAGTGL
jgi:hypothetical protein